MSLDFTSGFWMGVLLGGIVECVAVVLLWNRLPMLLTVSPPVPAPASSQADMPAVEVSPVHEQKSSPSSPKPSLQPTDLPLSPGAYAISRENNSTRLLTRLFPPNMPIETCEWLGVIFKQTILQQHSRDVNIRLADTLNREFAAMEQKSKILSSIFASNVNIGPNPPELKSIKILPSDSTKSELEYHARMVYNGGFSMELHTQLQLYSVVEAHLKVSVLDCSGDVNIRVASVPDSETDFVVFMMLTEDPQIRLDVQSVVGNFTDLSMINGIVTSTIKLVLRRFFVEPNGRKFRWSPKTGFVPDSITADEKKAMVDGKKKKKNFGALAGRLHIYVHQASGLVKKDVSRDTYCLVSFNRQLKRTKFVSKTQEPQWDEHFSFDVFDQQDTIILSIYERDRLSKDEFIGNAMVAFGAVPTDIKINYVQILKRKNNPEDAGTIRFEVLFEKFHRNRVVFYDRDQPFSQFDQAYIEVSDNSVEKMMETSENPWSNRSSVALTRSNSRGDVAHAADDHLLRKVGSLRSGNEVMEMFGSNDSVASGVNKTTSELPLSLQKLDRPYLLHVKIVQAVGLMAAEKSSFRDPYVMVTVGRNSLRTNVARKTYSPLFNERLTFRLSTIPKEVSVEVFDYTRFGQHKFLGGITLPLDNIVVDETAVHGGILGESRTYSLSNKQNREKSTESDAHVSGDIEVAIEMEIDLKSSALSPSKSSTNLQSELGDFEGAPTSPTSPTASFFSESQNEGDTTARGVHLEASKSTPAGWPAVSSNQSDTPSIASSTTENRHGMKMSNVIRPESIQKSKETAKAVASLVSSQMKSYFGKKSPATAVQLVEASPPPTSNATAPAPAGFSNTPLLSTPVLTPEVARAPLPTSLETNEAAVSALNLPTTLSTADNSIASPPAVDESSKAPDIPARPQGMESPPLPPRPRE